MVCVTPLRAIPTFQPVSALRQVQAPAQHLTPPILVRSAGHAAYVPTARDLAQTELLNAQAGLREAVRVYDFARREIGQANRGMFCNRVIQNITAERRTVLRRAAFMLFNKRRAQLAKALRRVAAAELALAATAQAGLAAAA